VGLAVVPWQMPTLVSLAVQGGMQVFQPLLGMEASVKLMQLLQRQQLVVLLLLMLLLLSPVDLPHPQWLVGSLPEVQGLASPVWSLLLLGQGGGLQLQWARLGRPLCKPQVGNLTPEGFHQSHLAHSQM